MRKRADTIQSPDDGYRALVSAVITQAVADLRDRDKRKRFAAKLFFISPDFLYYADALDIHTDGWSFVLTGKRRKQ